MGIQLKPLMILKAYLNPPQLLGQTVEGDRKIVPVKGGTVKGERIRGHILPGGGDWARTRSDGVLQLDVRLTIETDDEALIYCMYEGYRHGPPEIMDALSAGKPVDPADYYFRIAPRFETSDTSYQWLTRILAIGTGERLPDGPRYTIYEVL